MTNQDFGRAFSFSLYSEDTNIGMSKMYSDDVPWPSVLEDFVTFLEAAGYLGVRERISIKHTPYVTRDWTGPTHE